MTTTSEPLTCRFSTASTPVLGRGVIRLLGILLAALPLQSRGAPFPFTIAGDRFLYNGTSVFLNVISYQPLEPGQPVDGTIRIGRVEDDLRRWRGLLGDEPLVIRVYAQPTAGNPIRMPRQFYDGVRDLGAWIIRDIYFDEVFWGASAVDNGKKNIDAVIAEMTNNAALDRVLAWEIGNEFTNTARWADLPAFLTAMRDCITNRVDSINRAQGTAFSKWVTWDSWPPYDLLRTDGNPVVADLNFYSINAYSYEPARMRDHQGGAGTGTPYAGYLAALKERLGGKPMVVSETGLTDSPGTDPNHARFKSYAPAYRKGGLTAAQVAEGLEDRYWDARLAGAAGCCVFEWNDEWHKQGNPDQCEDNHPEEHFGLISFATNPTVRACSKLQADTIRDLFSARFHRPAVPCVTGLWASATSVASTGAVTILALTSGDPAQLRFRWEMSRGYGAGSSNRLDFYAGGRALGPATVTAIAADRAGNVSTASTAIAIAPGGNAGIQLLTLGNGPNSQAVASGVVSNVDLTAFKLVCYIHTDQYYLQPYADMTAIWIRPDGYWWTPVDNRYDGSLWTWLVPRAYDPPLSTSGPPPSFAAYATLPGRNDLDNDLLPDAWEVSMLTTTNRDRWDDPDSDGADNLEEFLAGTLPQTPDNDSDHDGLPDNWERQFFGRLVYSAADDPDGDGLANTNEWRMGLSPTKKAKDRDGDGLPDRWEESVFGTLAVAPGDRFSGSLTALDAYQAGFARPVITNLLRNTSEIIFGCGSALSGVVYQVLEATNLIGGRWSPVGGTVTAGSASVSMQVDVPATSCVFRCVGVSPP